MNTPRQIAKAFYLAVLSSLAVSAQSAEFHTHLLALSGETITGEPDGSVLLGFSEPIISNTGDVAYMGFMSPDSGSTIRSGIYVSSVGGTPILLVERGQPAAGFADGRVYTEFLDLSMNPKGNISFYAKIEGSEPLPTPLRRGALYVTTQTGLTPIAVVGEPVLGVSNTILAPGPNQAFNNSGQLLFFGALRDAQGGVLSEGVAGLFLFDGTQTILQARLGENHPDPSRSQILYNFRYDGRPRLNASGDFAIRVTYREPDGSRDLLSESAILGSLGNGVEVLYQGGNSVPGMPGYVFRGFSNPALNTSGQIAFSATIGSSNNTEIKDALFGPTASGLGLIVKEGDPAPGVNDGALFGQISHPALSDDGTLVFNSLLRDTGNVTTLPNDDTIFRRTPDGEIDVIAREGEPLPGATNGELIGSLNNQAINANGFITFLTNRYINNTSLGNALLVYDPHLKELRTIARTGQEIDVNPDPEMEDIRTIAAVYIDTVSSHGGQTGGVDGRSTTINDTNQIVYKLVFADRSEGVYITTVPEPTSLGLLAFGAMLLLYRRNVASLRTPANAVPRVVKRTIIALAATFLSAVCSIAPAIAQVSFETRALTGNDAPGTGVGVVFGGLSSPFNVFSAPLLNENGGVAFTASITGPGIEDRNGWGIWSERGNALNTVVLGGPGAPGLNSGELLLRADLTALNADGHTAFRGYVAGSLIDQSNDEGIWSEGTGVLTQLARESEPAIEIPDATYRDLGVPQINASGQTIFLSGFKRTGQSYTRKDSGIWLTTTTGNTELLVKRGDPAPGPNGGIFDDVSQSEAIAFNQAGETAVSAYTGSFAGIWKTTAGILDHIVSTDQAIDSTVEGVNFEVACAIPVLNAAGQIAVEAYLSGDNVHGGNNRSILAMRGAGLDIIAREGDEAPGTGSGVVFGDNGVNTSALNINEAGQVAFHHPLSGSGVDATNNRGIWSDAGGSLSLIARSGDTPPGFDSEIAFWGVGDPQLNDRGYVMFTAMLTPREHLGASSHFIESNSERSIWIADPTGQLRLIIQSGMAFDVNDDPNISELKIIDEISVNQNQAINDANQIAFRLNFEDGSQGVFVATIQDPLLLSGDTDGDGDIDDTDLGTAFSNYTGPEGRGKTAADGDTDNDGDVDDADLGTAFSAYTGPLSPANVPEPASALLLTMSALAFTRRRRLHD
ncbi:MAG: choice-of-anchor tandem repeat NxxGxxAF-containing protein [Phycisphaeraceae bacterium]